MLLTGILAPSGSSKEGRQGCKGEASQHVVSFAGQHAEGRIWAHKLHVEGGR